MAISAAKQAFLDALVGVKQKIDTGDDSLAQTQHFCYEPPISLNQLIGKGFQRCHVF